MAAKRSAGMPVKGVPGGWRDWWDGPDPAAEGRRWWDTQERDTSARVERVRRELAEEGTEE